MKKALSMGESCVICLTIKGFAGFIGRENEFHSRLGKELGTIAKTYGLGGVFHSDELPNYGITQEEVSLLRNKQSIADGDAFVLIAGGRQSTTKAADALKKRLQHATIGVPAETRAASLEGETTFLRPRPGAARMYPETDIPLIQVLPDTLARLRTKIPEPWEKQVKSFSEKYDLPPQLGEPMFDSERKDLFERVIEKTKLPPRYVASFLIDSFLSLSRNGVRVDLITDETLLNLFEALSAGKFAKEALPEILKQISFDHNLTLEEALSKAGLGIIRQDELVKIVDEIIEQNMDLAMAKGPSAHSILMGKVMQKVRGKADGKLVNETLAKRLDAALKGKS